MDGIAKLRLSVILLIDLSSSMRGARIAQVNEALFSIRNKLYDLEIENANVDIYLSLLCFSTEAGFATPGKIAKIDDYRPTPLKAGGWTNLHLAYIELESLLEKEKHGGMMPDFGGVAPILLLLTDGHPTGSSYKEELKKLERLPWFKAALRYGVAIGLKDERTLKVLHEFVGKNGDVIECMDEATLSRILQIVVLTASKVKSTSSAIGAALASQSAAHAVAQQEIAEALSEEAWEW